MHDIIEAQTMYCQISNGRKAHSQKREELQTAHSQKREELQTSIVKKLWEMEARINTARFSYSNKFKMPRMHAGSKS